MVSDSSCELQICSNCPRCTSHLSHFPPRFFQFFLHSCFQIGEKNPYPPPTSATISLLRSFTLFSWFLNWEIWRRKISWCIIHLLLPFSGEILSHFFAAIFQNWFFCCLRWTFDQMKKEKIACIEHLALSLVSNHLIVKCFFSMKTSLILCCPLIPFSHNSVSEWLSVKNSSHTFSV